MYKLQHPEDKSREVIHSENAIIKIEELDFSLVKTSNSQITTVQGLI
jgi:C4-type Zn-finger protein